jgi:hypothetical protein
MKKIRTLQNEIDDGIITKQQAIYFAKKHVRYLQTIIIQRPFLTLWINFWRKRKGLCSIEEHLNNLLLKND